MNWRKVFSPIVITFLLAATLIGASSETILTLTSYPATNGVHSGEQFRIALVVKMLDNWHINSNQPTDEFAIPTKVNITPSPDYTIDNVIFPKHVLKKFAFSSEPAAVFEGEFVIQIVGTVKADAVKEVKLSGTLAYQGCNDAVCLPPAETAFMLAIPVLSANQPTLFQNEAYFPPETLNAESGKKLDVANSLKEKGYFLTFLLIFIGGLGLNLTPCVYPLIPITVSYFGGQTAGKTRQRLLLALIFVLGMALVNSLLGTIAALSGSLLGAFLANPIVLIAIALIMLALALSMFGVYEFRLPNFLMNLAGTTRTGYFGTFLMGLTMGIIAAPCIGPFVLGLLTYVATVGKAWFGFLMFFTLSVGLGLPFVILAFFASSIDKLPRSGEWMVGVRLIFGLVLVGMTLYFVAPLLPQNLIQFVFPVYFILTGIYLILFNQSGRNAPVFVFIKNLLAIIALIAGVWLLKPAEKNVETMAWQKFNPAAYEQARQSGKPIILDFYADWCIPCKELDKFTFTDAEVIALSKQFALFKIDLTNGGNAESKPLQMQFEVRGVPTLVFIGRDGKEITNLRMVGFEKPQVFSAKMQRALE